jgi:hypothetical protein
LVFGKIIIFLGTLQNFHGLLGKFSEKLNERQFMENRTISGKLCRILRFFLKAFKDTKNSKNYRAKFPEN